MTGRVVVGGKVMRAPSLERLDRVVFREPLGDAHAASVTKTNLFLEKDAPRTWERDKAELVAFGVDGDVPFGMAAVSAGLYMIGNIGGVKHAWRAANDNNKSAAKAA